MSNVSPKKLALLSAFLTCAALPCMGQANPSASNDLVASENAAETTLSETAFAGVMRAAFPTIMASGSAPGFRELTFFTASAASAQADSQQLTNQTPVNAEPPSLGDLGFPAAQTQPNPQEQARLDKRAHMLKIHQRLGLITTVPLIAAVVSGASAGGKSTSSTSRDVHAALGSVTAGLYFTTAYFSIFAPKIAETRTRGQIRLHKALAWIHGPGMLLTPVLGVMAFEQKSRGEKIHGIASAHGPVAVVTAAAYGLAIVSVSIKF